MTAVVVYDEDAIEYADGVAEGAAADRTTWIRLEAPDQGILDQVQERFGVHPLAIEDVHNDVRPKVEAFDDHTFVLVKTARLVRGETTFEEEIDDEPVGIFIGEDWVVTYAPTAPEILDQLGTALEAGDRNLRRRGPDYLGYRVVDAIVDGYFTVLDGIETRIERVEDEVLEAPDRQTLAEINDARRELLSMRKLLWPTREGVSVLARGDVPAIDPETEKYYRDVHDHLVQLVDLVETYRDLTTGARDIYLNALSMSTNEVMKRLTVVATIVLPLTLVAGVYGMNFEQMPELGWPYAYPAVIAGMAGMALVLVWYFRSLEWI
ncbi:MAG: magnesium/cobalt transporter CorA [Halobacteriaceae archaeon]